MSTPGMSAGCPVSSPISSDHRIPSVADNAPNALPPINRPAITLCVILAVIMQALDTTIANVALPYIQGSVSASADQINWVLTSYIVAAAIMTPPSGFLANRFGRKRVLLTAIAGFSMFVIETKKDALARLDWLGFGTLSVAIGALQIFLDRGEQLDWFS